MTACTQCRQRKVRCRGGPDSCDACKRLGFQCSLTGRSEPLPSQPGGNSPVSVLRKRVGRACEACSARRARCSGDTPTCARCQLKGLRCTYSLSIRQYRAEERRRVPTDKEEVSPEQGWQSGTDNATHSTPATVDEVVVSPAVSAHERLNELLGCDNTVARQHIDAYFEYIYPVPTFSFLHRADFLRQYSSGSVPPVLLLAVCGAAARFLPSFKDRDSRAKSWIERAEVMVFNSLGKVDISYCMATVILGHNRSSNHQTAKQFHFLSLAARTAYLLKLHKEDTRLPFVEQECRRRLFWCIFTIDRFCAGGVPEYLLISPTSIHVQLPCRDRFFEFETTVTTDYLRGNGTEVDLPLSAYILRILDVRNRVLQYTKSLLETSTSPEHSLAQFQTLENELQSIHSSLPTEYLFSARAFQLRTYSPMRTSFIGLHLYWHHCHCELYRLLNPGYREALPTSVIQSTSSELVAYAQSNCLRHAVCIGEMIASTYEFVGNGVYVTDNALFVSLYQASCAILYACHRDSPAYSMDPAKARHYFTAFIETLRRACDYVPNFSVYVDDIRNMLQSINEPNAPLPIQKAAVEVDFRARPIPGENSSDEETSIRPSTGIVPEPDSSEAIQGFRQSTEMAVGVAASVIPPANDGSATLPHPQDIVMPLEGQDLLWPYMGATEYGTDFTAEPNLLWDWADALSSNFST